MKIVYYSVAFLLIFSACNSPKLKYCENEYLLIHHDTLKQVSIDFEQSEADFEKQLLKSLEVDSICSYSDIVGLPLDLKTDGFYKSFGTVNIPVIFFNGCAKEEPGQFDRHLNKHTTFQINSSSILLNEKLLTTEKDSIFSALEKHWIQEDLTVNDYEKFESRLYLSIDFPSSNHLIKLVLDSYIQFYLKKIDNYRQEAFGESLCKTEREIFESWIEDFIFLAHICYTDNCVLLRQPPPPPPLLE